MSHDSGAKTDATQLDTSRAVLFFHLATLLSGGDETPDDVIAYLTDVAVAAGPNQRTIRALVAAGWEMRQPSLTFSGAPEGRTRFAEQLAAQHPARFDSSLTFDGYLTVMVEFAKSFTSVDAARAEAVAATRSLPMSVEARWTLAWNEHSDGTFDFHEPTADLVRRSAAVRARGRSSAA